MSSRPPAKTPQKQQKPLQPKKPKVIDKDPTGCLPEPRPAAPRLAPGDFDRAATEIGCEAAAVRAVAEVESGGKSGFDDKGRPKILFEAHKFHKHTNGKHHKTHPHLSQKTWALGKQYYKLDQWTRMYEAMELDMEAAWKSASWGMFQIMGENHNGWGSVTDFVWAMCESEYHHLKSFLAFCKDNSLIEHLKNKKWDSFASGYNGRGYEAN